MKRTRVVIAMAIVVALVVVAAAHRGGRRAADTVLGLVVPGADARAPARTRVRVQVLNATRVRWLARRATFYLRDHGFDVVEAGTDDTTRDSTLVIDRSGHPEWARLVARALGGAPVVTRLDSSRYLDVTVLLGASWRPPAEPFYP